MQIKLNNVRLAFPSLFEARGISNDAGAEVAYGATFLFAPDSPNVKLLTDAITAVGKEKWADKAPEIMKSLKAQNKICLHSGEEKAEYDGFTGTMFVAARNKTRPLVIDRDKSPLTAMDGRPYGGCYVNAMIDVWAQDNGFGKRINASLMGVQFVKDGDSFSGARPASTSDFDAVEDNDDIL